MYTGHADLETCTTQPWHWQNPLHRYAIRTAKKPNTWFEEAESDAVMINAPRNPTFQPNNYLKQEKFLPDLTFEERWKSPTNIWNAWINLKGENVVVHPADRPHYFQ